MKKEDKPSPGETWADVEAAAQQREEIKAYLNYEDVQKDLETAKEIIKKLIPIAEMAPASSNWIITHQYIITIQEAKQFTK